MSEPIRVPKWLFWAAITIAVLQLVMPRAMPDVFSRRGLTCAAQSSDGCMVWVNKKRWDRYGRAEAGQ